MPARVCWEISEVFETAPSIYMDIDTPQHNKSLHLARKYKFCFVNDTENENQHVQFEVPFKRIPSMAPRLLRVSES